LAQEELNHEIDHLVQNGLTQKELDHAKKRVLNNEAFYHQSNANFGNQVAFEELMGLGFEHYQHRADEINRVTLEEMNRIIKKYLGVPGSVEVVVGPK
jgi:zinc protease